MKLKLKFSSSRHLFPPDRSLLHPSVSPRPTATAVTTTTEATTVGLQEPPPVIYQPGLHDLLVTARVIVCVIKTAHALSPSFLLVVTFGLNRRLRGRRLQPPSNAHKHQQCRNHNRTSARKYNQWLHKGKENEHFLNQIEIRWGEARQGEAVIVVMARWGGGYMSVYKRERGVCVCSFSRRITQI